MEIKAYREGKILSKRMEQWGCCHMVEKVWVMLHYLELIGTDGTRRYVYNDAEHFADLQENFAKKRFTSFHELLTTEEVAYEDRGGLKLKYYVPRPAEDYEIADPVAKMAELEQAGVTKLPDRETTFGTYDRKVNYHE